MHMTKSQVNDFVNDLYDLINNKELNKAKNKLINQLISILESNPQQPTNKTPTYVLLEFLLFRFNSSRLELKETKNDPFPLNSYLLKIFEDPEAANAILFHVFNYVTPQGYIEYQPAELIHALNRLKEGKESSLPKHHFSFDQKQMKVEASGSTHLMSI